MIDYKKQHKDQGMSNLEFGEFTNDKGYMSISSALWKHGITPRQVRSFLESEASINLMVRIWEEENQWQELVDNDKKHQEIWFHPTLYKAFIEWCRSGVKTFKKAKTSAKKNEKPKQQELDLTVQDELLNPTAIAKEMSKELGYKISAQKVNRWLIDMKFQIKDGKRYRSIKNGIIFWTKGKWSRAVLPSIYKYVGKPMTATEVGKAIARKMAAPKPLTAQQVNAILVRLNLQEKIEIKAPGKVVKKRWRKTQLGQSMALGTRWLDGVIAIAVKNLVKINDQVVYKVSSE
ncbi:MAG: hypothetical protein F6K55_03210 [Moorea sp. SIO4A3]|nr:hypothetical protein [Moorena sp. SIO4A3]